LHVSPAPQVPVVQWQAGPTPLIVPHAGSLPEHVWQDPPTRPHSDVDVPA
jgi:hypothetical protein